jgi:hypothetical protein
MQRRVRNHHDLLFDAVVIEIPGRDAAVSPARLPQDGARQGWIDQTICCLSGSAVL